MSVDNWLGVARANSQLIDQCEKDIARTNTLLSMALENMKSNYASNPEVMEAQIRFAEYCRDQNVRTLQLLKVADNNLDAALDKIEQET